MVEAHSTLFMSAAAVSSAEPRAGTAPSARLGSTPNALPRRLAAAVAGRTALGSSSAPSANGSVPGAERVSSVLFVGTPAPSTASPSV